MVVVPAFLLKKVYKKGSLKKTDDGICFDLKNTLGPGFISGFNSVEINGVKFEAKDVIFITDGKVLAGLDVSEADPIKFRLGQEGTLKIMGADCLKVGTNKIKIDIMNPEAGNVVADFDDNL